MRVNPTQGSTMSLAISNIDFLARVLAISTGTLQKEYKNLSIEEIVKAEAKKGNQLAIQLADEIMSNPDFLIQIFQLADPNNKIIIMSQMSEDQISQLLPQMDKKDLLQGLYFFSQEKLMDMLEDIPPEQLVKTVLEMFSKEQIVTYLPEEQLDKFLSSSEFDKNKVLKHMQSIPNEYLAQVLESITGEEVDENTKASDLVKQIGQLDPLQFQDALLNFQPTQKQQLTLSLCKEHEEWFQLFEASAYTNMITQYKQKPEVIKAMEVIEQEEIIKMVEELPQDLLQIVVSQMDTKDFAEQMIEKNPEAIAKLLAT